MFNLLKILLPLWTVVKPFLTFKKGKGTYATLLVGLLFVVLKQQLGIDVTEAIDAFAKIDPEVTKAGWWTALAVFARRALS